MNKFIAFYSYTGGVGRTSALANVAWRLAVRHALRVMVVDWDLEAPALDRFFRYSEENKKASRKEVRQQLRQLRSGSGIVDFLLDWQRAVAGRTQGEPSPKDVSPPEIHEIDVSKLKYATLPLSRPVSIQLITAGRNDDDRYVDRLSLVKWKELRPPVEPLHELASKVDVVLLDSRTGLTDIGALCTIAFPDGVVLLTAANEHSWEGIRNAAVSIRRYRPPNQLTMWLAVARVPLIGEVKLTEEWFEAHTPSFEKSVNKLWSADEHPDKLSTFRIPHSGRWTIGQNIVARDGKDDFLPMAYDTLADALATWVRRPSLRHWIKNDARSDLEREIKQAHERNDLDWLARALFALGRGSIRAGIGGGEQCLWRCAYLALGRGDRELYAMASLALAEVSKARETRRDLSGRARDAFPEIKEGEARVRDRAIAERINSYRRRTGLDAEPEPSFGNVN